MGISRNIKSFFNRIKKAETLEKEVQNSIIRFDSSVSEQPFAFISSENPKVSVILSSENEANYTRNTLFFLHQHIGKKFPYEIILVAENNILSDVKGITLIQNEENSSTLKNINKAIQQANGEYVYIINSKTVVQKDFLDELFYVFENFPNTGAVGSKITQANGTLLQAGALLGTDGQLLPVGNKKSYYPEVNHIRKTDYCTNSILFKRCNEYGNVNLFDETLTTISSGIADLCLQVANNHKKDVYYTPFSKVIQYSENNIIPENDLHSFRTKWENQLNEIKATTLEERVQELYHNHSVVIFCGMIPEHDKDSGSNRLKEIITGFNDLNYHVTLICKNTYIENPYIVYFQRLGINVFYEHKKYDSIELYLKEQNIRAGMAWFYSPGVFMKYFKTAKKYLPKAKLVYDMVDIHHLRYERAMELEPNRISLKKKYKKYKKIEFQAAEIADYVIPISDFEYNYMKSHNCKESKLVIISNIHYPKIAKTNTLPFEQRAGILFIGSTHAPNIDALYYLYNEIMPSVWDKIPDMKVNIIGNVKEAISDLNHPNFIFHGYVPDIEVPFISNKLMIAPLRYGAGVKGKIGQAFEYFLPVVTSTVGAEGMRLTDGENAMISDDKDAFASYIIEVYTNKALWTKLQDNSENSLEPFSKKALVTSIQKMLG